jgi:hypothetical protein
VAEINRSQNTILKNLSELWHYILSGELDANPSHSALSYPKSPHHVKWHPSSQTVAPPSASISQISLRNPGLGSLSNLDDNFTFLDSNYPNGPSYSMRHSSSSQDPILQLLSDILPLPQNNNTILYPSPDVNYAPNEYMPSTATKCQASPRVLGQANFPDDSVLPASAFPAQWGGLADIPFEDGSNWVCLSQYSLFSTKRCSNHGN